MASTHLMSRGRQTAQAEELRDEHDSSGGRSVGGRVVLLAAAESRAQEGAPPPLPPSGTLVDIGGWKPHLNCTGTREALAPLVILEPGIGDFSVEWSLVQPEVAKTARVCSYDRAGDLRGGYTWLPYFAPGPHRYVGETLMFCPRTRFTASATPEGIRSNFS